MLKGGEALGNEEGSSKETREEEEVIPIVYRTPGVRVLTPGVGSSSRVSKNTQVAAGDHR